MLENSYLSNYNGKEWVKNKYYNIYRKGIGRYYVRFEVFKGKSGYRKTKY